MICPYCESAQVAVQKPSGHNSYLMCSADSKAGFLLAWFMRKAYQVEYGEVCTCGLCGAKWYSKRTALRKRQHEILGQALGSSYSTIALSAPNGACLRLSQSGVTLFRAERKVWEIPYDEIASVCYQKSLGTLYGWLTLRDRAHRKRQLPQNARQAEKDRYTLLFDYMYGNAYYQVYLALKGIAEENKKAGLIE